MEHRFYYNDFLNVNDKWNQVISSLKLSILVPN